MSHYHDLITNNSVVELWNYLLKKHGGKLRSKKDSTTMKGVAYLMDRLGIMDDKRFMNDFYTTLEDTVYTPVGLVIGVGTKEALYDQAEKAVHEVLHIIQGVDLSLLLSDRARARIETDAFIASMEFSYWLHGVLPSISTYVNKLKSYSLRKSDLIYARAKIGLARRRCKKGRIRSVTVKEAIAFLKK